MPNQRPTLWEWRKGSGLIYTGACLLRSVHFMPSADAAHITIYDGRDATSGTKYHKIISAVQTTRSMREAHDVRFSMGIYVVAANAADEVTVVFTPV